MRKIVLESLKDVEFFKNLIRNQNTNSVEINKLHDNIFQLERFINEELEKFKNLNINNITLKIDEIYQKIKQHQMMIEELKFNEESLKFISLDPLIQTEDKVCFSEFARIILTNLKSSFEKIEKVNFKFDNLTQDFLNKIKKELMNDSNKILDDFRNDLKRTFSRIEDQMNDKVDKLNLDEIFRRLDKRILNEIAKKLDKNELKHNTNQINKKIDNLENKISKTFVNTLFDIQLEEAPLIMKKGVNVEKCASCNHTTYYNNMNNNTNPIQNQEKFNPNQTNSQLKFQQKRIEPEELNKTLKGNSSMINLNLPEISNFTGKVTVEPPKKHKKESGKSSPKIKNINTNLSQIIPMKNSLENAEKELNNILGNENDKKILDPGKILRATNKIFERKEKKNG